MKLIISKESISYMGPLTEEERKWTQMRPVQISGQSRVPGARSLAQQLRGLVAFPEDLDLVLCTHMVTDSNL